MRPLVEDAFWIKNDNNRTSDLTNWLSLSYKVYEDVGYNNAARETSGLKVTHMGDWVWCAAGFSGKFWTFAVRARLALRKWRSAGS
jgi:hypothetical protein